MGTKELYRAKDNAAAEDRTAEAAEYNAQQLLQISLKLDAVNENLMLLIKGISDIRDLMSEENKEH